MLSKCPNCKTEFIVHDEVIGACPSCGLKLLFREGDEIIEKVDIKEIEKKVDEITQETTEVSVIDLSLVEMLDVEKERVDEEIDKIIG